jgi:hypothetical protein
LKLSACYQYGRSRNWVEGREHEEEGEIIYVGGIWRLTIAKSVDEEMGAAAAEECTRVQVEDEGSNQP